MNSFAQAVERGLERIMGEKRLFRLTPLLFALVMIVIIAPAAAAQGTGTIEGVVLNAANDEPVGGITVLLDHFQGMTQQDSFSTETNAEGKFQFLDLTLGADHIYIARAQYAGVEYSSGMLVFEEGTPTQTVTLTIADSTDDDAGIVIERAHLIIRPLQEAVQIGQMAIISNLGDATYVGIPADGRAMATLRFFLPPDAAQVSFESGALGERFIEIEGGVADTHPVPPGESVEQIVISYNLPAQDGPWTVEYRFPYPVKALNVLLSGNEWELSSEHLTFAGVMGDEMGFLNYSGGELPAEETVTMEFTPSAGDPSAGTGSTNRTATSVAQSAQETSLWITVALSVLLLAGVLTYPAWRHLVVGIEFDGRE